VMGKSSWTMGKCTVTMLSLDMRTNLEDKDKGALRFQSPDLINNLCSLGN
jgi:hypothetical protein